MKKCPYCHTLMKDEEKVCPHCLKDVSNISSMPELSKNTSKVTYYAFIFGLVIGLGSVLASLSQKENKLNYSSQYDSLESSFHMATDSQELISINSQMQNTYASMQTSQFKEYFFLVLACLGACLFLYAIISYVVGKIRTSKKDRKK